MNTEVLARSLLLRDTVVPLAVWCVGLQSQLSSFILGSLSQSRMHELLSALCANGFRHRLISGLDDVIDDVELSLSVLGYKSVNPDSRADVLNDLTVHLNQILPTVLVDASDDLAPFVSPDLQTSIVDALDATRLGLFYYALFEPSVAFMLVADHWLPKFGDSFLRLQKTIVMMSASPDYAPFVRYTVDLPRFTELAIYHSFEKPKCNEFQLSLHYRMFAYKNIQAVFSVLLEAKVDLEGVIVDYQSLGCNIAMGLITLGPDCYRNLVDIFWVSSNFKERASPEIIKVYDVSNRDNIRETVSVPRLFDGNSDDMRFSVSHPTSVISREYGSNAIPGISSKSKVITTIVYPGSTSLGKSLVAVDPRLLAFHTSVSPLRVGKMPVYDGDWLEYVRAMLEGGHGTHYRILPPDLDCLTDFSLAMNLDFAIDDEEQVLISSTKVSIDCKHQLLLRDIFISLQGLAGKKSLSRINISNPVLFRDLPDDDYSFICWLMTLSLERLFINRCIRHENYLMKRTSRGRDNEVKLIPLLQVYHSSWKLGRVLLRLRKDYSIHTPSLVDFNGLSACEEVITYLPTFFKSTGNCEQSLCESLVAPYTSRHRLVDEPAPVVSSERSQILSLLASVDTGLSPALIAATPTPVLQLLLSNDPIEEKISEDWPRREIDKPDSSIDPDPEPQLTSDIHLLGIVDHPQMGLVPQVFIHRFEDLESSDTVDFMHRKIPKDLSLVFDPPRTKLAQVNYYIFLRLKSYAGHALDESEDAWLATHEDGIVRRIICDDSELDPFVDDLIEHISFLHVVN